MNRKSFACSVMFCLLGVLTRSAASAATAPVGQVELTVAAPTQSRGDASGAMHVVVWYPAADGITTSPLAIGPPGTPLFEEGAAARDAAVAPAPQRFPLLVISHGAGGMGANYGWLGTALAAQGYVVAAVDHPGNHAVDPQTVQGMTLWWLRASDVSRAIDAVLADRRFTGRIDRGRIGAIGHSLGGYTMLEVAGARSDLLAFLAYCAGHAEEQVCTGEASNARGLGMQARALQTSDPAYAAELARSGDSYRDPRVRAVLVLAPALAPALTQESLHAITVPVEIIDGLSDAVTPLADNAAPLTRAIPGAQLHVLDAPVGHYSFLDQCTAAGQDRLPVPCNDSGPIRASAHVATVALAEAFFAATLGAP